MNRHRRPRSASLTFLLLLSFLVVGLALPAQADVPALAAKSFSNGASIGSNSTYAIVYSIGQPIVGHGSNADHEMGMGFWYMLAGLGSPTAVTPPLAAFRAQLHQNMPNPFNPSTTIRFVVGKEGRVSLRVFDVQGREVDRLVDGFLPAGEHELIFQPRNLASGVYLYQLKTPDNTFTRRLVLLK